MYFTKFWIEYEYVRAMFVLGQQQLMISIDIES